MLSGNERARIKIGISAYKDRGHIPLLLQSLDWYTFINEPVDVVVCDDGSPEEYKKATREACAQFGAHFIEHETNRGIPAVWNTLARSLDDVAEIIVILNNDLLMPPHWLNVAVHFLDANKDNPHVGSCYWNPVNQVPIDAMRGFLPNLSHTSYVAQDALTGLERQFDAHDTVKARTGQGQGLGRVMCPCGCGFAFTKAVFQHVGEFDERLTSFHEESDWGTRCASKGRASFGFAYPRPYHGVSATFSANPELHASVRMTASRKLYRKMWEVPAHVSINDYFQYVNNRFMPSIPKTKLKYLRPDYDAPAQTYTRYDGATIVAPALIELEEEF
jgi:GT2 family glycosyltransferase